MMDRRRQTDNERLSLAGWPGGETQTVGRTAPGRDVDSIITSTIRNRNHPS